MELFKQITVRLTLEQAEIIEEYKKEHNLRSVNSAFGHLIDSLDKVPPKKETPKVEIETKKEEPVKEKKQEETVSFFPAGTELNF